MKSFKDYLTERVYQLSNIEQKSIDKTVDAYMRIFDPKALKMPYVKFISLGPERVFKNNLNERGYITIGLVEFYDQRAEEDRTIPVYVSFDKESKDKGTYIYETDEDGKRVDEYILLHFYKLKYNRDVIEDALVHELNHAKQPYKSPGKYYSKSKLDYYTDPVEVHNYVSNIIKAIENEYIKANAEKQKAILSFVEVFARTGKLPDVPESEIIKRIGKDEFVNFLYDNKDVPKLKKEHQRLINKLMWLYTNLREYEAR
jgi:hypothetical protein